MTERYTTSNQLFSQARHILPGGVNSPVRAFKGVGGAPVFFKAGQGPYLIDADDNRYIDYVGSWGPMILGHAHPDVLRAIVKTAESGLGFGAPTQLETELAERICSYMPAIEMIRMVNSGTEATMSAIRLARAYTGRDKILKFEGCYHGHADSLLVKAGSGALTLGIPTSPGVPASLAQHTLTLSFNDLAQVKALFAECGDNIAAIIVEPVAGNMNCIPPLPGFLEGLRQVCDQYQSLLIFDEVMTGFRVALGGAQALYKIKPDLTTLGKVIGAGLPVGAFGGRRDIMEHLAPLGSVYQAGTLSGNPVAMSAGLAMLDHVAAPGFYEDLSRKTSKLCQGVKDAADQACIAFCTQQVGGMFGWFFSEENTVCNYAEATACDVERFKKFFHRMLDLGIYLAPSAYEAGFVSSAHQDSDLEQTIVASAKAFAEL